MCLPDGSGMSREAHVPFCERLAGKFRRSTHQYELSNKASWRKLHVAVNQNHYFEACVLTDRFSHDDQQVEPLLEQINDTIDHFSGDGAYDGGSLRFVSQGATW